ncbi:MAG: molybdenum cofactor guanylyltransferase [Phycisphaerales bacterium]|nr:molybdenum cofactor guanylyltransferase [Phycisphaerales bacterium]
MSEQAELHAGILLGGKSTRMGQPKHTLRLGDRSFVEIIHAAVAPFTRRVVALGRPSVPFDHAIDVIPDAEGVKGPLAGILAALRSAPEADWLIVACDMPFITTDAIAWIDSFRPQSCAAIIPRDQDGIAQPLLAIYRPSIVEDIMDLIAAEHAAPRSLAKKEGVLTPLVPEPLAQSWRNVNTPESYDSARRVGEASSRTVLRPGEL